MSLGLPRFSVSVTPSLHSQVRALATSRKETMSDLMRRALDTWSERQAFRIERKTQVLSVRLDEKQRAKLARVAKRLGLSSAACMSRMLEQLMASMEGAESEASTTSQAKTRKQAGKQAARKAPSTHKRSSTQAAAQRPAPRTRSRRQAGTQKPAARSPQGKQSPAGSRARASSTSQQSSSRAKSSSKPPAAKRASRTPTRRKRHAPTASAPLDLPSFAALVQSLADSTTEGRFGDRKVFISSVWKQRQGTPLASMGLDAFKRRLVEANRAGLLALSRADLIAAMDPVLVRESETRYLTATFHFIESPRLQ